MVQWRVTVMRVKIWSHIPQNHQSPWKQKPQCRQRRTPWLTDCTQNRLYPTYSRFDFFFFHFSLDQNFPCGFVRRVLEADPCCSKAKAGCTPGWGAIYRDLAEHVSFQYPAQEHIGSAVEVSGRLSCCQHAFHFLSIIFFFLNVGFITQT